MAGNPSLIAAATTQFAGGDASQTSDSFSVPADEALGISWHGANADGPITMTVSDSVGTPDVQVEIESPFGKQFVSVGIWVAPGSGSYTCAFTGAGTSFQPAKCHAWSQSSVDGTTPAINTGSDSSDGGTDTGTVTVTNPSGNVAIMAVTTETSPSLDGTSLVSSQIGTSGIYGAVQYSASVNPDLGSSLSGQSAWVWLSVADGGGGGGGSAVPIIYQLLTAG